ncbi:MAG: hypothetical protein GTO02_05070 [Candidatus Dadabacteria bacterium]|nr:hypothetical protein [Candidatus Dadabacteria bacterium]NIQ13782.1 hypothetical protein [Candidatus Dadabacteria bacterium]
MLENTENYFKDPELEISLSQLETGCIPYVFNNENYLLFKDIEEKINLISDYTNIDIQFEHIERPEFPTVEASFLIKTNKNLNIKYQYFFLTESPVELNFLNLLKDKKNLHIYFLTDIIMCKIFLKIPDKQIKILNIILDQLN